MLTDKDFNSQSDFNKISIKLASPEVILRASRGEILKPETINYRTHKPERDGLFCERIFGPIKDYECACGKYKRIRYKGIICDRCGVEVTEKKVRRERVGHINLVTPVAHVWYFRSLPNKIGHVLGLSSKNLDMIIYYERYVVIQPGVATHEDGEPINKMDFLTEDEYLNILERLPKENQYLNNDDPNKFIAKMGGECLYDLLSTIDLEELAEELRHKAHFDTAKQRRADALKRLQIVESLRKAKEEHGNRPEWMVLKVIPVIPPDLRPLVALDGGRFAASDLNDLYRRVIIRNNRLKRLIEIKAPEIILRNEKRMLQEAVDSLFDNTRKSSAIKTESNRPLKSLSDSLKGKQGRFRQNLLGKRVDYSARSVVVVGPELKLHECGLPKEMAAELYKPFIIRKIIERGIVRTVKSAKKIIDKREPIVWDILENTLKGHPVLLNRAPTLHRLGIQAFQPKLIEGKAIQLHPLVCSAFNADFDGDQMAVHLPLSSEAILEAQLLMLSSNNILNPANGAPITVPSQDMILGLYYLTKEKKATKNDPIKGEGSILYSAEEVIIGYNEKKLDIHACIKVKVQDLAKDSENLENKLIETTVGRVLFNEVVPKEVGYINVLLSKKSLRDVIGKVLKATDVPTGSKFLDDIKNLGYRYAFKGGLSFALSDIKIPKEKQTLIDGSRKKVDEIVGNYNMGLITNNERYNQVIDVWTETNAELTELSMKNISEDQQGFNSVYMMLDSGARGSKEQIRQLIGMRGLMAKPRKSSASSTTGGEIVEHPILSNFKEGLTILEYFTSTHGARKGLADTALKTADAGYLTRKLVDVAQDVVILEEDCGTLRGVDIHPLKKNEEIVESIGDRVLGRIALEDVKDPNTGEILVKEGKEINEEACKAIDLLAIESIQVRSVFTCESERGVCAACYGRNLATGKMTEKGDAVGIIAAQSIGEPGTQLTLRTFHVGGIAGNVSKESSIIVKFDGTLKLDSLKTINIKGEDGNDAEIVVSRTAEVKVIDNKTNVALTTNNIPYGSKLFVKDGQKVKKGEIICSWDPYNAVIISEYSGKLQYEGLIEGITFEIETDEQTGFKKKTVIQSKEKTIVPVLRVLDKKGNSLMSYNLPVSAHLLVEDGDTVEAGSSLVKIPRSGGKSSGDITGGLPRVVELFEARNPSNPAINSEIDGVVSFGKIKRGSREVFVESKTGEKREYLIKVSNQLLVQENDFVKSGMPLSEGSFTPNDMLRIKGTSILQQYLIDEIQEVYRLQGVKINDKHFEVIVKQMLRKVQVVDRGDTLLLEDKQIFKEDFIKANKELYGKCIIEEQGDSKGYDNGEVIGIAQAKEENALLAEQGLKPIKFRKALPATAIPIIQGITKASLQTKSFISAASFQETTKVLNEAALAARIDDLKGLKENVIVGQKIPAGSGLKEYNDIITGSAEEYQALSSE